MFRNYLKIADKIYRIGHEVIRPTLTSTSAASPTPLAPALHAEYPEIEHLTRFYFDSQVLFEYKYELGTLHLVPPYNKCFLGNTQPKEDRVAPNGTSPN